MFWIFEQHNQRVGCWSKQMLLNYSHHAEYVCFPQYFIDIRPRPSDLWHDPRKLIISKRFMASSFENLRHESPTKVFRKSDWSLGPGGNVSFSIASNGCLSSKNHVTPSGPTDLGMKPLFQLLMLISETIVFITLRPWVFTSKALPVPGCNDDRISSYFIQGI